jgi:hypothetical protein
MLNFDPIGRSDKTDTSAGSMHPVIFTLGNLSIAYRLKACGMRTFAMLPLVLTRTNENLTEDQRTVRDQIYQDAMAFALRSANESANGIWLVLPGDQEPTLCVLRRVQNFTLENIFKNVLENVKND